MTHPSLTASPHTSDDVGEYGMQDEATEEEIERKDKGVMNYVKGLMDSLCRQGVGRMMQFTHAVLRISKINHQNYTDTPKI